MSVIILVGSCELPCLLCTSFYHLAVGLVDSSVFLFVQQNGRGNIYQHSGSYEAKQWNCNILWMKISSFRSRGRERENLLVCDPYIQSNNCIYKK